MAKSTETITDANRTLMQQIFAGLAQGDGALLFESMTDDVRWRIIGTTNWSKTYEGKQAILRDMIGEVRAILAERIRLVPQRFIADGELVAVEARGDSVTKAGVPYRNEYCMVFRIVGDQIAEVTEYNDTQLIVTVFEDRATLKAGQ
ncbi:nuclear transport factor 2 family protein [Methylocapsa sp. S129]|uniref:nuclear transport factor 2 family protein n=1 Tax=Methylocapsa sp. S129 TaxID=1641869 RepID=UPI00131BB7E7|nr:nuclear transport factor 2 family protein [Methylocapsa sp. S129]